MSALEASAKPNLVPLIMGDLPLRVPHQAGKIIATWTVKTAMMFHSTMTDTPVIPGGHHEQLYKQQSPPHQSYVFVGRYTGTQYSLGRYNCNPLALARRVDDGLPLGPNGYSITLVLGQLILQVIGVLADRPVDMHVPRGFPLFSIWPAQPWQELTVRNTVDDKTLGAVERAISREREFWDPRYPYYSSFYW